MPPQSVARKDAQIVLAVMERDSLKDICYSYCMVYAIWDSLKVVNDQDGFWHYMGQHVFGTAPVSAQVDPPQVLRAKRDAMFDKTFKPWLPTAYRQSTAAVKSFFHQIAVDKASMLQDIGNRFERVQKANAGIVQDLNNTKHALMATAAIGGCAVIAVSATVAVVTIAAGAGSVALVASGAVTAAEATTAMIRIAQTGFAFSMLDLGYSVADKSVETYQDISETGEIDGVVAAERAGKASAPKVLDLLAGTEHALGHVEGLAKMANYVDYAIDHGSELFNLGNPKLLAVCKAMRHKIAEETAALPVAKVAVRGVGAGIGTMFCASWEMTEKLEKLQRDWNK